MNELIGAASLGGPGGRFGFCMGMSVMVFSIFSNMRSKSRRLWRGFALIRWARPELCGGRLAWHATVPGCGFVRG